MFEKEFEHDRESRSHSIFMHLYTQEMSELKVQLKVKDDTIMKLESEIQFHKNRYERICDSAIDIVCSQALRPGDPPRSLTMQITVPEGLFRKPEDLSDAILSRVMAEFYKIKSQESSINPLQVRG